MTESLATERLLMRKWAESDAKRLYALASHPDIGRWAGWKPHTGEDYSRAIIRTLFSSEGEYAITLKENDGEIIGCIGIHVGVSPKRGITGKDEAEIGYWIGRDYWDRGFATEALMRIISYLFEDVGLSRIWCGYFDGNDRSRRVMEKCGMTFAHRNEHLYNSMLETYYNETMMTIGIDEYIRSKDFSY